LRLFQKESGNLVGVDVSSSAVKVVELARGYSRLQLKCMAIVPMPPGAIMENAIVDPEAVSRTLKQAYKIARPSTHNVCFGMSGNAVIMKTIILPAMTEIELESQINYEAEQLLPFNIDEVYLDFQILGEAPHDPEAMEVIIVACKRDIIDNYRLVFNNAGLKIRCIDCSVFCMANVFERIRPKLNKSDAGKASANGGGADALIDIGATMIHINILNDGRSEFVRDQFYGGDNLTQGIMQAHNLTAHAAEQIKLLNFPGISGDILEEFYINLTSELGRSLDYYAAKHAENPANTLYLTGGCALIPEIAGELEQRMGIETRALNPLHYANISKRKFNQTYIDQVGPRMMAPMGLALRRLKE